MRSFLAFWLGGASSPIVQPNNNPDYILTGYYRETVVLYGYL